MITSSKRELTFLFLAVGLVFVWSGVAPADRVTWVLEIFPAVLAAAVLVATYRRFPLTRLVYWLIAIHACILMVGGHYTYAKVPLFDWIAHTFGLARNHFDRLGHFAQGFVPAMVTREILFRNSVVTKKGWLFFLVTCVCLAVSAFYELFEWWTALILHQGADAFLGTQGDIWDTQWDMCFALIGAITAQTLLARWHDRQMT